MVVVTVVTVTARMGTRTAVMMAGTVAVTVVTVAARMGTTTAVVTAGTAVVVTTVAAWVGTLGGCGVVCVGVCGDERGGRLGK